MLRRQDYKLDFEGGFGVAQLPLDDIEVDSIRLPRKRRAYTRGPDCRAVCDALMMSLEIAEVRFA